MLVEANKELDFLIYLLME